MKNITILLPLHKLDDLYSKMLANALSSITEFADDIILTIICPKEIRKAFESPETLKKYNDLDIIQKFELRIIENSGNTDFCSQVNIGIDNTSTEWFTILEVDDEFKKVWFTSMNQYMKENPQADVFLPIVKDINVEGKFLSFTNESTWAYGFTTEQGVLDNEVLLDFQNYQISGGLYKTQVVKDNGKFKENIKLTFGYEFLLRLTHNNVRIMTVPKIGYQHVNFREDSLFWCYKNDEKLKLSEKEVKFWVETAKKEFFFKDKREVTYVES